MSFLSKIFGDASSKFINNTEQIVKEINAFEVDILKLTNENFLKKTQDFKDRLKNGESLDDILPEAFALVR